MLRLTILSLCFLLASCGVLDSQKNTAEIEDKLKTCKLDKPISIGSRNPQSEGIYFSNVVLDRLSKTYYINSGSDLTLSVFPIYLGTKKTEWVGGSLRSKSKGYAAIGFSNVFLGSVQMSGTINKIQNTSEFITHDSSPMTSFYLKMESGVIQRIGLYVPVMREDSYDGREYALRTDDSEFLCVKSAELK